MIPLIVVYIVLAIICLYLCCEWNFSIPQRTLKISISYNVDYITISRNSIERIMRLQS